MKRRRSHTQRQVGQVQNPLCIIRTVGKWLTFSRPVSSVDARIISTVSTFLRITAKWPIRKSPKDLWTQWAAVWQPATWSLERPDHHAQCALTIGSPWNSDCITTAFRKGPSSLSFYSDTVGRNCGFREKEAFQLLKGLRKAVRFLFRKAYAVPQLLPHLLLGAPFPLSKVSPSTNFRSKKTK